MSDQVPLAQQLVLDHSGAAQLEVGRGQTSLVVEVKHRLWNPSRVINLDGRGGAEM